MKRSTRSNHHNVGRYPEYKKPYVRIVRGCAKALVWVVDWLVVSGVGLDVKVGRWLGREEGRIKVVKEKVRRRR